MTAALTIGDEPTVVELALEGSRLEPQVARWSTRLAESYLRQGRPEEAVAAYGRAASAPDGDVYSRVGLALALESAHHDAESLAEWSREPSASEVRTARMGRQPHSCVGE